MKKTITILACLLVVVLSMFAFVACNNTTITVDKCWADNETLTYDVLDSDQKIGSLVIDLTTDLTDKDLAYGTEMRTYASANVKITETIVTDKVKINTTILANNYTVLAVNKTFTDLVCADNSYTLQSYHDGKNYVYTYIDSSSERSEKLKVGTSGYTDNEFLYYYIRCYNIGNIPSSVKVADPKNNRVCELSTKLLGTKQIETPWNKESSLVTNCNEVYISSNDSPSGSGIYVYYLPEEEGSFGTFSFKSTKYPVKIVENNISYLLVEQTARKER